MKNVFGWIAVIGLGILIYKGYSEARKQGTVTIKIKKKN